MDPLLEVYILENSQLIEQLEEMFLNAEKNKTLDENQINEVFRIMHTIKGSSSMMTFDGMATLAHRMEDCFSCVREKMPPDELWEPIFDLVLESVDIFKEEMEKIQSGGSPDADLSAIIGRVEDLHAQLKGENPAEKSEAEPEEQQAEAGGSSRKDSDICYKAYIEFQEDSGMETIRAFGIVNDLKPLASCLQTIPENINDNCDEQIASEGFTVYFCSSEPEEHLQQKLEETILLKTLNFEICPVEEIPKSMAQEKAEEAAPKIEEKAESKPQPNTNAKGNGAVAQSYISVNVEKIDMLMALMGEIVTAESMVVKNPDIVDLKLENFDKQARQLKKLTNELQDVVMSIRMVPIASTFHKMKRLIRDMCKKVNKEVDLVLIGEQTEVDKNILDHLSDPLMHLIRNSVDHGIETPEERKKVGKPPQGTVTLEARNAGGDVIVLVADDGRGLDREKLINKAREKGITQKASAEISDKEAYNFILEAGFSTKQNVTEFSGRGVGMDVVRSNIEAIGGSLSIDSVPGEGMTLTMHIPLTLAIIDGMNVAIGDNIYVIPIQNIQESLEGKSVELITDPDGNEMAVIRGECLPIVRMYQKFGLDTKITDIKDSILVLVQAEKGTACLMVDKLIGEAQAVIKPIPVYISKMIGKYSGVAGCTIMGDGSISLIADVNGVLGKRKKD